MKEFALQSSTFVAIMLLIRVVLASMHPIDSFTYHPAVKRSCNAMLCGKLFSIPGKGQSLLHKKEVYIAHFSTHDMHYCFELSIAVSLHRSCMHMGESSK